MEASPSWKAGLLFAAIAIILMSLLATFDLTVLAPQRLEDAREARREAPPKLQRPSERAQGGPAREIVTAFRIEDWRKKEEPVSDELVWNGEAADVYLKGYLAVRAAENLLEAGNQVDARVKYDQAAKVFSLIKQREPTFEPAMVDFRRRKIDEALSKLDKLPAGAQSGAVDSPADVRLARQGH